MIHFAARAEQDQPIPTCSLILLSTFCSSINNHCQLKPLPNDKIFAKSKLRTFADHKKKNNAQMMISAFNGIENIVG